VAHFVKHGVKFRSAIWI